MDKNVLINMHRILVYIRSDIKYVFNESILDLLIAAVKMDEPNIEFVRNINKLVAEKSKIKSFFTKKNIVKFSELVDGNSTENRLNSSINEILVYAFNKAKELLANKQYEIAYDLVDAIHVLPETYSESKVEQLDNYWKVYIAPFRDKWGDDFFSSFSI